MPPLSSPKDSVVGYGPFYAKTKKGNELKSPDVGLDSEASIAFCGLLSVNACENFCDFSSVFGSSPTPSSNHREGTRNVVATNTKKTVGGDGKKTLIPTVRSRLYQKGRPSDSRNPNAEQGGKGSKQNNVSDKKKQYWVKNTTRNSTALQGGDRSNTSDRSKKKNRFLFGKNSIAQGRDDPQETDIKNEKRRFWFIQKRKNAESRLCGEGLNLSDSRNKKEKFWVKKNKKKPLWVGRRTTNSSAQYEGNGSNKEDVSNKKKKIWRKNTSRNSAAQGEIVSNESDNRIKKKKNWLKKLTRKAPSDRDGVGPREITNTNKNCPFWRKRSRNSDSPKDGRRSNNSNVGDMSGQYSPKIAKKRVKSASFVEMLGSKRRIKSDTPEKKGGKAISFTSRTKREASKKRSTEHGTNPVDKKSATKKRKLNMFTRSWKGVPDKDEGTKMKKNLDSTSTVRLKKTLPDKDERRKSKNKFNLRRKSTPDMDDQKKSNNKFHFRRKETEIISEKKTTPSKRFFWKKGNMF